jgi:REP element-mobilizing transposase RayT
MKKLRKNTQLSLINPKRAGRPAIHDIGIRHISRPLIKNATSFHLTIKVRANKADIQSKRILKAPHHGIKRARLKKLRVIHYTLEFNHVHLLVECCDNKTLQLGMQALGISFSKAINKIKKLKGGVYKHRYHLRMIASSRELRNVLHYIFHNGIKHRRALSLIDPFNSLVAESRLDYLYPKEAKKIWADIAKSDFLRRLQRELYQVLEMGEIYFAGIRMSKN